MKRSIVCIALILGLVQAYALADDAAPPRSAGTVSAAVKSEMPVLRGETWVAMDDNTKVAFIWGAGHVVTIERVIMEKYPDQKRDTFVTKVVEASAASPATMSQIAASIDKFYADNPDKLDTPVMAVIWDTMVKPNIAAGIAGEPLK